jgi:2,5-diketo-D-gluconate reductase B
MHEVFANGAKVPAIGFGTYGMERADMLRIIPAALKKGFRHIDTAQIYHNEEEVGECIAASGIPRSEVFVTTKVWVANYPKSRFAASVDESLRKLQSDYIDLLLLHWPHESMPLAEQVGLLNETVRAGRVRHISVSNFNRRLLEQARGDRRKPPAVNPAGGPSVADPAGWHRGLVANYQSRPRRREPDRLRL